MLQGEIHSMLKFISNDKKALDYLYKKRCFEYKKEDSLYGEVAIVNNKALVSFIRDVNNEQKLIATAKFKDGGTVIFKLLGDNFSQHEIGFKNLRGGFYARKLSKEEVIKEIETICKYCEEVKRGLPTSKSNFFNMFSKRLSKRDVANLLEETIQKLECSRFLEETESICPKVNIPTDINCNFSSYPTKVDKLR